MYQVVLFGSMHNGAGYIKSSAIHRLATEIRRMGYTCRPIDCFTKMNDMAFKKIVDKFISEKTRVIGFSSTLMSNFNTVQGYTDTTYYFGIPDHVLSERIAYLRKKAPKAMIVVGGSQTLQEFTPELQRYKNDFDLFVDGQGEGPIKAIVQLMMEGKGMKVREIDGLQFMLGDDYPYNGFQTSDIVWLPEDIIDQGEALTLEVARGCVFKCAHCTYDLIGKDWGDMMKDPATLRQELLRNYQMWGTTSYMIPDDTLNDSIEKVRTLHEVFTSLPFQVNFVCYLRLDIIEANPEMAPLLLEAGIKGCNIGIETLDAKAGRAIGKGMGEKRVKATTEYLRKVWGNNVVIKGNFITGLPYESVESMYRTIEWAASEDCPLHRIDLFALRVDGTNKKSKMETEQIEKYGYTFTPGKTGDWTRTSDGMSRKQAYEIQQYGYDRLHTEKPYIRMINSFSLPALVNVGITYDDIKTVLDTKSDTIRGKTLHQMMVEGSQARVNNYIRRLINEDHVPQTLPKYRK